ncbi:hypothetical protein [Thaumasiovibrio subtropicus]|uniref:hypothetical protein n=1 Tax=Thaumasiovibrio subtropicus TaxID=1891207 RepID=UPI000B3633EB|nr:hypothetical protein [Thaumasiovibrio subtropicus]
MTASALLNSYGSALLVLTDKEQQVLSHVLTRLDTRFAELTQRLNDKPEADILLGLLTDTWQNEKAVLDHHADAMMEMQQTLNQYLDANAIRNDSLSEWLCISKLWLLAQGYQNIDFSLANEYAENISLTVNAITNEAQTVDRSTLMHCYYIGQDARPRVPWYKSIQKTLFGKS